MLAIGVLMTVPVLLGAYAGYALLGDPSLPFGRAGGMGDLVDLRRPRSAGIILLVAHLPGGADHLVGSCTWTARTCVAAWSVATLDGAPSTPGPMDGFGGVSNPFGLPRAADRPDGLRAVRRSVVGIGTFLVALVSVFLRVRRARGAERQQLKWFAYAMVVTVVAVPAQRPPDSPRRHLGRAGAVVVAMTAIPAGGRRWPSCAHRLYDIDRIISRTLVYGALTATLVAAYSGSVLLFRVLLDPLTGHSDLAVAASTLAVAALFRPVRARIQVIVDRRFYRSRYDAARTVEAFTGRLRQEVDLDAVSTDLDSVVREAVQPAHVSLWLRGPER